MSHINDGAVKVIEIIGISSKSFDDAINQALVKASKSVKGITGLEVTKHMPLGASTWSKHTHFYFKLPLFPTVESFLEG